MEIRVYTRMPRRLIRWRLTNDTAAYDGIDEVEAGEGKAGELARVLFLVLQKEKRI